MALKIRLHEAKVELNPDIVKRYGLTTTPSYTAGPLPKDKTLKELNVLERDRIVTEQQTRAAAIKDMAKRIEQRADSFDPSRADNYGYPPRIVREHLDYILNALYDIYGKVGSVRSPEKW